MGSVCSSVRSRGFRYRSLGHDRWLSSGMTSIWFLTGNRWVNAETWGTDNHTYPSKNVEGEEMMKKSTDVWGELSQQKTRAWESRARVWCTTHRHCLYLLIIRLNHQVWPTTHRHWSCLRECRFSCIECYSGCHDDAFLIEEAHDDGSKTHSEWYDQCGCYFDN